MSNDLNPIIFQKVQQNNHVEYHLPLDSNLYFFNYSNHDSRLDYMLRDSLIDNLGFKDKDFYSMGLDIVIYTMILNYFAEDKAIFVSSSKLKEIDESLEPLDAYWNNNLSYSCFTKTPLCYLEGFEHYGGVEIAPIKKELLSTFSLNYSDPIESWTFFIGAQYDELLGQINNSSKKPNIETILYISDYVITINYGEEEGYFAYILIQAKHEIDEEIAHLEGLLKAFKKQYESMLLLIREDETFHLESMMKLKETYNTKPLVREFYDLKSELEKVDWKKIETVKENEISIPQAIMLISKGSYYQALRQYIYDEEPSYYIIPFLQKIITFGNREAKIFSYSFLEIILLEFPNSKRHYQSILSGLELYLDELEKTTDGELAGFILDILTVFVEDKKLSVDRVENIKELSPIGEYLNKKPKNIYSTREICNEKFRKRPAMWARENTLEAIFRFISTYRLALHDQNITDTDKPDFYDFFEWVKDELGYSESTAGWAKMILWYSLGEDVKNPDWEALGSRIITKEEHQKSIELFFEYFDIFYIEGV